jgi:hypothetical protein
LAVDLVLRIAGTIRNPLNAEPRIMAGKPCVMTVKPCVMTAKPCVMAELGPATHVFSYCQQQRSWVAGLRRT